MIQSRRPTTEYGWTWMFRERIPSTPIEGKRVIEGLLTELERHQWDENDRFSIHLAVEEALVNAIKHGNQDDSQRFVDVEVRVSPALVRIEIEDEGDGFDPRSVPDPTDDENLELPSGRGLMLMRSFMNIVEFNERGNRVRMEKSRTCGGG